MTDDSLRAALREGTRDLHGRLDATAGPLADLAGWRRYLAASFAFRAALEPALAGTEALTGWRPVPLVPALRRDLSHFGTTPPVPPEVPILHGMDEIFGALYVAEGSALGARLVEQRAQALGLTPDTGAGHLAVQRGQPGRWRLFLDRLHGVGPDVRRATTAARRVFALALVAYDLPGVTNWPPPT